jgi:hypothetical protein
MVSKMSTRLLGLIFLLAVIMSGCVKPPEQPRVEQHAAPEAVQPPAPAIEEAKPDVKLPPPNSAEVRNAIARIYKNAVIVEADRFIVGDFNGDGFQDVAVVVKPAEDMLAEINSEVANWILEDPQTIVLPDPNKTTQPFPHQPPPAKVAQSDTLLAVLHGYGPTGWRDPRARQTYLLRNGAGANMKSQQLTDALRMVRGKMGSPKLSGDVINQTIAGSSGFLYYTGAKYKWYKTGGADGTVASRR